MDGERNLALDDFLRAVGLAGCWSARGPTDRAQILQLVGHPRRRDAQRITWDQRFALALAFRAWRTEGPCPDAIEVLNVEGVTVEALRILAHRWNGRPPR